jgi:glycosyltransferase involved in cell wall biosynthesis
LKILHVGKFFPPFSGGLEIYMRDAMLALGRHGIESAALVHKHSLSRSTSHETLKAGKEEFQVVRVGTIAQLIFTPISPAFPWHLHKLIKSFKPDVLHLHLPNPSAFWALGLLSARRIPWVLHWHSDVVTTAQSWRIKIFHKPYRLFERALIKRAKAIVATSEPYLNSSETLKPWLWKCHAITPGVDTEKFDSMPESIGLSTENDDASDSQAIRSTGEPHQDRLNVLAIGRLTYYKGFRYLIEAAAKAPNVFVSLVGHGQQEKYLKRLVASLGLQNRVTFHHFLSDRELAHQMALCDCFCLPSIERTEAFGLVLIEAMYFGKATIISDVPGSGMGWIVDDGITGIKVNPADADALAEAFTRLSENRKELVKMGRNGKEKFHQCFEIDRTIEDLIKLYKQVTDANQ